MSKDCVLDMDPPGVLAIGSASPALYVGRSADNAFRSPIQVFVERRLLSSPMSFATCSQHAVVQFYG